MTVETFVRIVWTVFEKIEKKSKNDCFLAAFGLILAMCNDKRWRLNRNVEWRN